MAKDAMKDMSWADMIALRSFLSEKQQELGGRFIMNGYDKMTYEELRVNLEANRLQEDLNAVMKSKNKLDEHLLNELKTTFLNEKRNGNS